MVKRLKNSNHDMRVIIRLLLHTMHMELRQVLLLCAMGTGLVAAVVVHELGHSTVCSYFGYDSPITINLSQSHAYCEATGAERTYVRLAGGGTAALFFLLALIPDTVRRNDYARLFLLTGGITNMINVVIETSFSATYSNIILYNPSFGSMLPVPAVIAFVGFSITVLLERHLFQQEIKTR